MVLVDKGVDAVCCVGVIGPLNSEVRELPGWSHELVMELG